MLDWIDIKGALLTVLLANFWMYWTLTKMQQQLATLQKQCNSIYRELKEFSAKEDDGSYIPD